MIVSPDFPGHWKTQLLIRLTGTHEAVTCLLKFWAHCQNRKTHRFTGINPSVLAAICQWSGDANVFWEAMLTTYLEKDGEEIIAHQWDEYNGTLVSNWKNGTKGGRPKNPNKTHGVSHGVSDKSRVDKIREDKRENPDALAKDSGIPSLDEVTAFGETYPGEIASGIPPKIPKTYCQHYFDACTSKNRWVHGNGTPINWKHEIGVWWRRDWRGWAEKTPEFTDENRPAHIDKNGRLKWQP